MSALLEVRDLTAGYESPHVLRRLSLDVEAGETVCIIGRNGSGKSTLVGCLMGYLRPARGRIRLDGRDLVGRRPHEIVRLGMTAVLQERTAFGGLPVGDNLLLGGYALDRATRRGRVEEVLARFPGLAEKRNVPANRLSSGEQRILEIARALVLDPRLLLLDEARIGLAAAVREEVRRILVGLRRDGIAVLMLESERGAPLDVPGSVRVLQEGRV
jgi:branched-chain amino acid transport system ATP-binding protein